LYFDPSRKIGCLVEFKSLFGDRALAPMNYQLRTQAVAVTQEFAKAGRPVSGIVAALVQPNSYPKTSVCLYTPEDLLLARREILAVLDAADDPRAPAAPGKHCEFCPAKAQCKEHRSWVSVGLPAEIKAMPVEPWTPQQWALFLEREGAARKWLEAKREEAKAVLEKDPAAIPGWTLKPWPDTHPITDGDVVAGRLYDLGASPSDVVGACDMVKERVKSLVKSLTGAKGQSLKDCLNELFDGCLGSVPQAPRIVKDK
jgi:hypothetical protein